MHQPIQSLGNEHGFLRPQSVRHKNRTFLPEFFSREWGFPTCLVISFLPVLLICIFATPAFYTIDDVMQAMYPEGGYYGQTSYLMLFTLAPISAPLGLLGKIFPNLPIFALCQLFFIVVSTTFMVRLVSGATNRPLIKLFRVTLLIACESFLTTYLTYTAVAFVLTASGLSLLVTNAINRRIPHMTKQDVAGSILIFLGTCLRPESGFSTFILFVPFMLWVLVRNRHISSIIRGVIACMSAGLAYVIGMAAYLFTPGWQELPRALKVGRAVTDTPPVDASKIQEISPNLSENDVFMLYDWWFGDSSVFSLDVFQKVSTAVKTYSLSNIPLNGKRSLLLAGVAVILLCCLAWLLTHNTRHMDRSVTALQIGIILCFIAMLLILALRDRMVDRVIFPLVVTSIYALLAASCGYDTAIAVTQQRNVFSRQVSKVITVSISIICIIFAFIIPAHHYGNIRVNANWTSIKHNRVQEYTSSHPNQVFILDAVCDEPYVQNHNIFETFKACQYQTNEIFCGGWLIFTDPDDYILNQKNLDKSHRYGNLINRSNVRLIANEETAYRMLTFLREHYDSQVTMTNENSFNGSNFSVYRYDQISDAQ